MINKTVIETTAAPGAIGPYSQGFIVNGYVYTSGQIPVDPATGASVSKSSVAMASSLIMACFNIGMFLCSPFQSLTGSITGDQLYVPLYIGAAVFVIGAVFFAIYNPFAAKKAANAE